MLMVKGKVNTENGGFHQSGISSHWHGVNIVKWAAIAAAGDSGRKRWHHRRQRLGVSNERKLCKKQMNGEGMLQRIWT